MPRTVEDVEAYLVELGRTFELADPSRPGTYVVSMGENAPAIALSVNPPIVALRLEVGAVPKDPTHELALARRLLAFNASDLLFASYGFQNGTVVLGAALELENLDKNEIDAVLSDIDLALTRHVPELRALSK